MPGANAATTNGRSLCPKEATEAQENMQRKIALYFPLKEAADAAHEADDEDLGTYLDEKVADLEKEIPAHLRRHK